MFKDRSGLEVFFMVVIIMHAVVYSVFGVILLIDLISDGRVDTGIKIEIRGQQ